MNTRFMCDNCGCQPCVCYEAGCRRCDGEGNITDPLGEPRGQCGECGGEGWIKCSRGGVDCPFERCYCEEAWDRQQEDRASEPLPTAQERHERAYAERQALRGGYPL